MYIIQASTKWLNFYADNKLSRMRNRLISTDLHASCTISWAREEACALWKVSLYYSAL